MMNNESSPIKFIRRSWTTTGLIDHVVTFESTNFVVRIDPDRSGGVVSVINLETDEFHDCNSPDEQVFDLVNWIESSLWPHS